MFWPKRIGSGILAILACFVIDINTHHFFGSYEQRIIALVGIYVILAVSLNLINGITGQFSIGHAAFYQVGAYLSGYISRSYITEGGHHPMPLLWLFGMILVAAAGASVAGFIVGLPSLRLKGDYLAIVTLGFGEIIRILVQNTDALGGPYALDKIPKIQDIWLVWLIAFICIAVCRNLLKTARGLTFLAVREDEIASSAMGVNVTRVKVTAFVLGSAFAGAAGALLAHYEGVITPATFTMDVSFIILTMVVLGGTGSITGSVFAAMFLSYLPEYLRTLHGSDGQALVVSGTAVVAALASTVVGVAGIKAVLDRHLFTPQKRGLIYVGIVIGAIVLEPVFSAILHPVHTLATMQVEAAQLRMVIFAVTLIVLMLLRPQGIFAHHEFSWDWVKKLLGPAPLRQTVFSFPGRVSRGAFWVVVLFVNAGSLVVFFTAKALADAAHLPLIVPLCYVLWFPLALWSSLAIQIKRWHDLGVTGWAVLLDLVPFVGGILSIIVLGFVSGRPEPNGYGSSPLSATTEVAA